MPKDKNNKQDFPSSPTPIARLLIQRASPNNDAACSKLPPIVEEKMQRAYETIRSQDSSD